MNLLKDPRSVVWWAAATWLFIALVDTFIPGAQTSPVPTGPKLHLRWLPRLYVPLQLVMPVFGLKAAANADWFQFAGLAFGVGFGSGGCWPSGSDSR